MTATPNHALQRTRAAVTPDASGLRLAPTTQRSRQPRGSLSLRSLGVATRTMKLTTLGIAFAVTLASASAEDSKSVESAGLGRTVLVRGQLGQPLGRVITIEGSAVEREFRRTKAEDGKTLFRVSKVDGQALPQPTVIRLDFFGAVRPPNDSEKRTFRGYENGGFTGIPNEANKVLGYASSDWYFETHFCVIK